MAAYQIDLEDTITAVSQLAQFLSEIIETEGISFEVENAMQLSAEEAVVNIITHGYKWNSGMIDVKCEIADGLVTLTICDEAPYFNPLTLPPADVEAGIDDRRIGGLGVHLIRSLMDEVRYKQTDSGNCLIMQKALSS